MRLTSGDAEDRRTPVAPWVVTGCVALVLLAVIAMRSCGPDPSASEPAPTTSTTAAPTSTVVLIPPVTLTRPSTTTTQAIVMPAERDVTPPAANVQVEATVRKFVAAWLLPDTPDARRAALTPVASPALVSALADVPADVLPVAEVQSVTVESVSEMAAETLVVMSDGMRLKVSATNTRDGWRVSYYGKAA